jgi:hypothetical protein
LKGEKDMTKIVVEDSIDGERISYAFVIDRGDLEGIKLSALEQDIINATKAEASISAIGSALAMIIKKIEQYKIDHEQLSLDDPRFNNLDGLYVDHLVDRLESRPIGHILQFLARYCGWERIKNYADNKIRSRLVIR